MAPIKFRSRIDTWLGATLGVGISLSLISVWLSHRGGSSWVEAMLPAVVGAGLPVWLLLSTSYTVRGDQLVVICGPFRWRIPVASITAIVPTRSFISGPALSMDRLRIDYDQGRRALLVSPDDQQAFIRAIESARGAPLAHNEA